MCVIARLCGFSSSGVAPGPSHHFPPLLFMFGLSEEEEGAWGEPPAPTITLCLLIFLDESITHCHNSRTFLGGRCREEWGVITSDMDQTSHSPCTWRRGTKKLFHFEQSPFQSLFRVLLRKAMAFTFIATVTFKVNRYIVLKKWVCFFCWLQGFLFHSYVIFTLKYVTVVCTFVISKLTFYVHCKSMFYNKILQSLYFKISRLILVSL